MANIIKLENIKDAGFSSATGGQAKQVTEEYVCGSCRHLVGKDDKFCWQCGGKLESSSIVEHYHRGKGITNGEFKEKKKGVG